MDKLVQVQTVHFCWLDWNAAVQGIKIEQYISSNKIERIKEMIIYDELNIIEIAQKLNYCNVSQLNLHFKKTTGFSPYNFKQLKTKRRKIIEGQTI